MSARLLGGPSRHCSFGRGNFPAPLSECEVRAGLVRDVARARLRATAEGTVRLVCEPSLDKAAGWERPEMIAQLVGGLPRHCASLCGRLRTNLVSEPEANDGGCPRTPPGAWGWCMSVGEMAEAQSRALPRRARFVLGWLAKWRESRCALPRRGPVHVSSPVCGADVWGRGIRRGTSRRRWGSCDDPPCGASWWERPEVSAQLVAGSQALFF